MNSDPASLDNLRDIAEPTAVSWWPPAVGWWILLAAALVAVAIAALRAIRLWRANAYRAAAIREVKAATDSAAISEVLKRTALVAFPRTEIAALSGENWCRWLARTAELDSTSEILNCLTIDIFQTPNSESESDLRRFALMWIKKHRRPLSHR